MQTSTFDPKDNPENPAWVFLAKFPLIDLLPDRDRSEEVSGGALDRALRDLAVSPEMADNIKMALADFAKGPPDFPCMVRLFCSSKTLDDLNSSRESQQHRRSEQTDPQAISGSNSSTQGGWGFFLIEKAEPGYSGFSAGSRNSVGVYLYREGE